MDQLTADKAVFRALVRSDGKMVGAMALVPGGGARFFILARREEDDAFVGRVAAWVKSQSADGIRIEQPDMLPEGTNVPEFFLRLRATLATDGTDSQATEFDVKDPRYVVGPDAS